MAKTVLVKKEYLLPNIPDKFNNLDEVRDCLQKFRQTINDILVAGFNSGIVINDNKIAIGMDNIDDITKLVD